MAFINLMNAFCCEVSDIMYIEFDFISIDDWDKYSSKYQTRNLLMALGNCIYYKTHQQYTRAISLGCAGTTIEFKKYCDDIAAGHTELLRRKFLKSVWNWLNIWGFIDHIYGDKAKSLIFKLKCKRFIREYFVYTCCSVYEYDRTHKQQILKPDFINPDINFKFMKEVNGMYPLNKFLFEDIIYLILLRIYNK